MADKTKEKPSGFAIAVLYLIIFCSIGIFAFMPVNAFEAAFRAEQQETIGYGGERTNSWILSQSSSLVSGASKYAIDLSSSTTKSTNAAIGVWTLSRIQASLIWVSLVAYRVYLLIMWLLLGFPFFIATTIDAHYNREISKDSFVAQSPIRHKVGVKFFYMAIYMGIFWLFVPFHVPTLLIPIFEILFAMSSWMWIVNLQKRL